MSKGLLEPERAHKLDMRGAIELLFASGFSTAEQTSDISGRGVGMDAVRAKIRELGGEVLIDSTLGQGTCVQIRLPLTLAIVSALQVEIDGDPYAIPLDRVDRTLSALRASGAHRRGAAAAHARARDAARGRRRPGLRTSAGPGEHRFAVILQGNGRTVALAVDDLVGQRELVTRPLPAVVSSVQPVSAGAALADGRIALIVDCDALTWAADPEGPASPPVAAGSHPYPLAGA